MINIEITPDCHVVLGNNQLGYCHLSAHQSKAEAEQMANNLAIENLGTVFYVMQCASRFLIFDTGYC